MEHQHTQNDKRDGGSKPQTCVEQACARLPPQLLPQSLAQKLWGRCGWKKLKHFAANKTAQYSCTSEWDPSESLPEFGVSFLILEVHVVERRRKKWILKL